MRRLLLLVVGSIACGGDPPAAGVDGPAGSEPAVTAERPAKSEPAARRPAVEGAWRATLETPGGELPFELRLQRGSAEALTAVVVNGPERVAATAAWEGSELVLGFEHYDSEIRSRLEGDTLTGQWVHTMAEGPETMRFSAKRGEAPRFGVKMRPLEHPVPASIDGDWSAVFTDPDGSTFPAQGVFASTDGRVDGTFLTGTGDYRYLDGRYYAGRLELSCFDGAHAFLLRADVDAEGALRGDFWAMGGYHATWRATRMADGAAALTFPDAAVSVSESAQGDRFVFAFPDLDGTLVTQDDERFSGKVVLVDVFGTWCPNCNDYAPVLAKWHRDLGPRGLELVGLAFEMSGDPSRDRTFVRRHAQRYGIEFPLLLAGNSSKTEAAEALPTLTKVAAYPTTILIDRAGKVRRIHSGFAGPATGEHHTALVASLTREIEDLLDEPAPQ